MNIGTGDGFEVSKSKVNKQDLEEVQRQIQQQ
jgi:hypothetical protein